MKVIVAAALLAATGSIPASAQDSAQAEYADWTESDWSEAARTDVLAAYREFIENHPGVYDLANPGFLQQLGDARSAGLAAAEKAPDRSGYALALARFSSILSDGHAQAFAVSAPVPSDAPRYWPGFVALWRGDRLLASTPDRSAILNGSQITACDGAAIEDFLRDRLQFRNFRPNEQGQWWVRPSQLFYSIGETTSIHPRECTFALSDGEELTRILDWTVPDAEERDFYGESVFPAAEPTLISEPRDGIFVIGLGDFDPDEGMRAEYAALYSAVESRRDELLKARAIVLDMRGNNGGSSEWSRRLASILWGESALKSRVPRSEAIDWRVSPDTIAYLDEATIEFRENGELEIADWLSKATTEMKAARDAGEPLWRETEDKVSPNPGQDVSAKTDFTAPVYVMNWGLCASACLDANDFFTLFDNTKLIGTPTSADSTYMEVRSVPLPAGPGQLVIPSKVYVGRPRGWGVIYEPDIEMDQLDWSTEAFLDRIETDLVSG
ncbi:S41 family peptidase [Qipengyuania sp. 483]